MRLAYKLKDRIQIRRGIQTPNDSGGYDLSYETLATVWAEIKSLGAQNKYIRRVALTDKIASHEIIVRWIAVQNFGKEYSKAFSTGFDSIGDMMPLKSDYFIFLQRGSTIKGRLFKVMELDRDEKNLEYLIMRVMEQEEQGTGFPV